MNYKNYVKLKEIGNSLCNGTDFQFKIYRHRRNTVPGATDMMIPEGAKKIKRYIRIYLSAIKDDNYPSENTEFLAALICIYHEYKHLLQFYAFQSEVVDDNLVSSFLLSLYDDNKLYMDNHEKLFFEIEAEQYGVMQAYSYMIEHHFSETETLECLTEYIIRKKTMRSLYAELVLPSEISNIEDVNKAIEAYKQHTLLKSKLDISIFFGAEHELLQRLCIVEQQTKYFASCVLKAHPLYKSFFFGGVVNIHDKDVYLQLEKIFPVDISPSQWLETSLKYLESK